MPDQGACNDEVCYYSEIFEVQVLVRIQSLMVVGRFVKFLTLPNAFDEK